MNKWNRWIKAIIQGILREGQKNMDGEDKNWQLSGRCWEKWKEGSVRIPRGDRKMQWRRNIWKIFHHDGRLLEMSAQNSLLCFEIKKGELQKMRTEQKGRQDTMLFWMCRIFTGALFVKHVNTWFNLYCLSQKLFTTF